MSTKPFSYSTIGKASSGGFVRVLSGLCQGFARALPGLCQGFARALSGLCQGFVGVGCYYDAFSHPPPPPARSYVSSAKQISNVGTELVYVMSSTETDKFVALFRKLEGMLPSLGDWKVSLHSWPG